MLHETPSTEHWQPTLFVALRYGANLFVRPRLFDPLDSLRRVEVDSNCEMTIEGDASVKGGCWHVAFGDEDLE
jgi:hypothetical protein